MSLAPLAKVFHPLPRIVKFLAVGLFNTGFSYSIYALGIFLGLPYAAANLIALLSGILVSFRTQSAWVFRDAKDPKFWRFVLAWIAIYVANIGLIEFALRLGLNAYWAGLVGIPFIVVFSYCIQRLLVFQPTKP